MRTRRLSISASLLLLAITPGCSAMHGDPNHPTMNPHPVKRYEITATADAPGPWDSVKGYISYEVVNPDCTPFHKFNGVHEMPQDVGHDVKLTQVSPNAWKGYFYRDLIEDADYYGLGMCHWDAVSVGGTFVVQGATFGSGDTLNVLIKKGPQAMYFKKSAFLTHSFIHGGDGTTPDDPEVVTHPDVFFPIKIAIREATP